MENRKARETLTIRKKWLAKKKPTPFVAFQKEIQSFLNYPRENRNETIGSWSVINQLMARMSKGYVLQREKQKSQFLLITEYSNLHVSDRN